MTTLMLGIAWLSAFGVSPATHAQQEITWKVVNRFPLVRVPEDLEALAQKRAQYLAKPDRRNPEDRIRTTRWDAFEQRYDRALIEAPVTVRLSLKTAPSHGRCTWSVEGVELQDTACSGVTFDLPWQRQEARVKVEVGRERVGQAVVHDQLVRVRSMLVVSLGDSYSSGEGVPDLDLGGSGESTLTDRTGAVLPRPTIWWDQRCHRSLNSGPAQAAMDLARRNDHVQVVFVSFACSGAEIHQGLLSPYVGRETYAQLVEQIRTYLPNGRGFVPNREGGCRRSAAVVRSEQNCEQAAGCTAPGVDKTNPFDCGRIHGLERRGSEIDDCDALCVGAATGLQHSSKTFVGALPSQLNALLDLLCDTESDDSDLLSLRPRDCERLRRPIDALVLSIGANDIGFGPLVRYLVEHGNAFDLPGFRLRSQRETAQLAERFEALDHALRQYVSAKQGGNVEVFVSQYPDPTDYSASDDRCGARDKVMRLEQRSFSSWLLDVFFMGVSENEIGEARSNVINPLMRQVLLAASQNGWTLVDGHINAFKGHGYCHRWTDAGQLPWTHTHDDSLDRQGWLPRSFDQPARFSSGAMHPNILGQWCHSQALVAALEAKLLGKRPSESLCNRNRSYD